MLISTPEATWLQLCALDDALTNADLVAAGDYVVREPEYPERGRPFSSRESLGLLVDQYRGRGKRRAAEALTHIRQGSDSRPESLLRLLLIGAGLPEPELNPIIRDRDGQRIGRADLVFREWKVIVEYDGDQHRTRTAQYEHDMWRLERYTLSDWSVLRVRAAGLFISPEATIRHVREVLKARGWHP
ncbi:DUF559 domain-containing protein [Lysinibacter cavernae]|uniref:Very-short-patch-repair endonuclease n=1 Tax=Lysinibacter cavernae TaxID=1640652 RepID=A0A7X5R1Z7_9MICO|nr:very-short-patch-repair endonuclease [Lysinibacter cavernae]